MTIRDNNGFRGSAMCDTPCSFNNGDVLSLGGEVKKDIKKPESFTRCLSTFCFSE